VQWTASYDRAAVAEVVLFVAVLVVPVLIGAVVRYLRRPWWWGASLAVAVVFVAAIAPAPEEGESRLVLGDLVFLAVVAAIASALVWLGAWLVGRFAKAER
jgi:drug/metabolite transporter (DMT)-like permease